MAMVRDPAFWKRFSTAVHLNDVELQSASPTPTRDTFGKISKRPELPHQDSWLERQNRKKKRRTLICWAFWIGFMAFAALITVVIIWLINNGMFTKLQKKLQGV